MGQQQVRIVHILTDIYMQASDDSSMHYVQVLAYLSISAQTVCQLYVQFECMQLLLLHAVAAV
jgi:hypothetical protein